MVSPNPRVHAIQDILGFDSSVQTPPGLESPALDLRRDLRWKDKKFTNMLTEYHFRCLADTRARLAVLGSWTEDIEDRREILDCPVGLIRLVRSFVNV